MDGRVINQGCVKLTETFASHSQTKAYFPFIFGGGIDLLYACSQKKEMEMSTGLILYIRSLFKLIIIDIIQSV